MTNQPYRHAATEPVRSYSFDLRDIIAVIPRDLQSGAFPGGPRVTLQLPPEALDSTRKYLATSLGVIWRACPGLFAQPVTQATDRMVVLQRPNEGVVSPFRIVTPGRPAAGTVAHVIARSRPATGPAAAPGRPPYLQEPVHFGQVMAGEAPAMYPHAGDGVWGGEQIQGQTHPGDPVEPSPVGGMLPAGNGAGAMGEESQETGPVGAEGNSPFLTALRDGVAPAASMPFESGAAAAAEGLVAEVVTFTLEELFRGFAREALPFDPGTVSAGWNISFPVEFITRQFPSGRVVASLSKILECAEPVAREALAGFAGNQAEVSISLNRVFERLPAPKKPAPERPVPLPEIFAERERGEAGQGAVDRESLFPGRFEPKQTVLEPIVPPQADLSDAPEYVSPVGHGGGVSGEEEVGSLDELEARALPERETAPVPGPNPGLPGVREAGQPDEDEGLPSRHVPDFGGLGFAAEPMADLELRAIFATQEVFTPQRAVECTAHLPGVEGAVFFRQRGEVVASQLPMDAEARRLGQQAPSIFRRIQDLASELGFAGGEVFTLHTVRGIVSFFGQGGSCLAILHGQKVFEPGMREKLMLIARGMASMVGAKETE